MNPRVTEWRRKRLEHSIDTANRTTEEIDLGKIPSHWKRLSAKCYPFEANGLAACPPVVEYSREFQQRAAEELLVLPDGSAVVEMMGDYAVMRDSCQK